MKRKVALLVAICLVVLSMAACSEKDKNPQEELGEEISTDADISLETSLSNKKRIYLLVDSVGDPFWLKVQKGALDAANELDVQLIITGVGSKADAKRQVQQIIDAVSLNADGIIISPANKEDLAETISQVNTDGTPVILLNSLAGTKDYSAAYITDPKAVGKVAAQEMLARFKSAGFSEEEPAQVGIMVGVGDSTDMIERLNGFGEYWDENAPDAWEVVNSSIKISDGSVESSKQLTIDLLGEFPDIKGVFGADANGTNSLALGLNNSKRDDVILLAMEETNEISAMIAAGNNNVVAVVSTEYYLGYQSVVSMVEFIEGKTLGAEDAKIIDTGVLVVDNKNPDGRIVDLSETA